MALSVAGSSPNWHLPVRKYAALRCPDFPLPVCTGSDGTACIRTNIGFYREKDFDPYAIMRHLVSRMASQPLPISGNVRKLRGKPQNPVFGASPVAKPGFAPPPKAGLSAFRNILFSST